MAFDLDYLIVDCDHRLYDDIVQKAVNLQNIQVNDAAVFGEDMFGDEEFGDASYRFGSYMYGLSGYFIPCTFENSIIAVFPLKYPIANNPSVYVKLPTEYLRRPVPEFSYSSKVTVVHYNGYHFYGDGSIYNGDDYEFDAERLSVPYVLWKVVYGDPSTLYRVDINGQDLQLPGESSPGVPGNSIIIFRYDNRFDWIVDYNVQQSFCPKCLGTSVNNDIYLTPRGKLSIVFGTDKLIQHVSKVILTEKGLNPYFPWIGTTIKDLIISDRTQNIFILRSEIIEQLANIKNTQLEISSMDPNYYDPPERLEDIVNILSLPSPDPRVMNLQVIVLTRTLQQVQSKKLSIIRR